MINRARYVSGSRARVGLSAGCSTLAQELDAEAVVALLVAKLAIVLDEVGFDEQPKARRQRCRVLEADEGASVGDVGHDAGDVLAAALADDCPQMRTPAAELAALDRTRARGVGAKGSECGHVGTGCAGGLPDR